MPRKVGIGKVNDSVNNNTFAISLEQNALDSLIHGVEHFVEASKDTDLKYTLLHVFHAVELYLKARLAQIDQLLIFADQKMQHTIDFRTSIDRLRTVGISLSEQNIKDLNSLRQIRNSIEHYQLQHDRAKVEYYIGRAMYFLDRFLQDELGMNLEDKLDKNTYHILTEALYTYQERLKKAEERLKKVQKEMEKGVRLKEIPFLYTVLLCDACGEEMIIIPDPTAPRGTVHCFFCDARFFVETCERCSSYILLSLQTFSEDENKPELCEYCWDDMDQRIAND